MKKLLKGVGIGAAAVGTALVGAGVILGIYINGMHKAEQFAKSMNDDGDFDFDDDDDDAEDEDDFDNDDDDEEFDDDEEAQIWDEIAEWEKLFDQYDRLKKSTAELPESEIKTLLCKEIDRGIDKIVKEIENLYAQLGDKNLIDEVCASCKEITAEELPEFLKHLFADFDKRECEKCGKCETKISGVPRSVTLAQLSLAEQKNFKRRVMASGLTQGEFVRRAIFSYDSAAHAGEKYTDDAPRTYSLHATLTPNERKTLQEKVAASGLTQGEFVRRAVLTPPQKGEINEKALQNE